jgi:hypothetical protein
VRGARAHGAIVAGLVTYNKNGISSSSEKLEDTPGLRLGYGKSKRQKLGSQECRKEFGMSLPAFLASSFELPGIWKLHSASRRLTWARDRGQCRQLPFDSLQARFSPCPPPPLPPAQ